MGFFEDTITKAKEILGETGKATEEVITIQKLKFEQASLKSAINKNYEKLGRLSFDSAVNEADNSEKITELIEEIKKQNVEFKDYELKIATAKKERICECGAINGIDSKYCKICGKEL